MQAAKNMAGMIKHKVEDAAATAEEKKDIAKAEAEEKIEKLRAHDEASKEEATKGKNQKEEAAERLKDKKLEERSSGFVHHERQNPIGDCPTPADLDMPVESPSQPAMHTGTNASVVPQTIAAPAEPLTGAHLTRK